MNIEEVQVIIEKDGRVRIEVHGVQGPACLDITQALEQALGGEIEAREMTPEALDEQPLRTPNQTQAKQKTRK